jgi:hypothetical protein
MESGSVALIYIDPPFNTGRRQTRLRMKTVRDEAGDRVGFGGHRYRTELVKPEHRGDVGDAAGYADQFDDFLGFLRPRLVEAYRVLAPPAVSSSTSITARSTTARSCWTSLFGRECFQNEIIWAYDYGARATKRWPAKHDNILWYSRDPKRYTFNLNESDRIPYMAPGLVGPREGRARQDAHRRLVAHHRLAYRQGKDRLRHPEAAGHPGADRARALQSRRPGAGLLRRQRDHGRGGSQQRPRLLHGRREPGSHCSDGKTLTLEGRKIMIPPSLLFGGCIVRVQ